MFITDSAVMSTACVVTTSYDVVLCCSQSDVMSANMFSVMYGIL